VPAVRTFAEYVNVPVGFHWYRWHRIPFDNDYPHYLPPSEGFAEGVRELTEAGVYVMPYINGRLWDTRDKGIEDFEFTRVARPAATKDEKGEVYIEKYGANESDGSPVRLAVMCPTTATWQKRIGGICQRLFDEFGVDAVYIDQVAAMSPKLCMDKSHRHPLGGGHWWTKGYWQMLKAIRDTMPKQAMLTSECNAEPYAHVFDGYLSWTWQHDGQVPAFTAVYGGAIQCFGRAFRGQDQPTKDIGNRMRIGQQFVFGEQIGWFHPDIIHQETTAAFIRQVVGLRWKLRRYFYVGEMARPPELEGKIPKVKADWRWNNEWWVTTDAVMTGAWKLANEKKLVLLFVNVSDDPVTARFRFDGRKYDLAADRVRVQRIDAEVSQDGFSAKSPFIREIEFPPRSAWAWEVRPGK
jgi:hypothetical protein